MAPSKEPTDSIQPVRQALFRSRHRFLIREQPSAVGRAVYLLVVLMLLLPLIPLRYAAALGFEDLRVVDTEATSDGTFDDSCPDLATDGDGAWIAVWRKETSYSDRPYKIGRARSTDGGQTWSTMGAYLPPANTELGCPSIATDGNGHWVVTFSWSQDLVSTIRSQIRVMYWSDGGPPGYVTVATADISKDGSTGHQNPQVAVDPTVPKWLIVWDSDYPNTTTTNTGTDRDIFAASSSPNGESWGGLHAVNTNAATDTGDDENPSLAVTTGVNDWTVAWSSNQRMVGGTDYGTDRDIFWSRPKESGGWDDPKAVGTEAASDSVDDHSPSVALMPYPYGGTSIIGVLWIEDPPGSASYPKYSVRFYGWTNTTHLQTSGGAVEPRLAVTPTGTWAAVWRSLPGGLAMSLEMRYSTDLGSSWTGETIGPPLWNVTPAIAVDSDNRWIVAMSTNSDLGGTLGSDWDIVATRAVPPKALSIVRQTGPVACSGQTLEFVVEFTEPVSGVDASDFATDVTGSLTGVSILSASSLGGGQEWVVSVSTVDGTGTVSLRLLDNDTIVDGYDNPLGGHGSHNGAFNEGVAYNVELAPAVISSVREDQDPTLAQQVSFRVTFDRFVQGVGPSDFILATPLLGASVINVSGVSPANEVNVLVSTGSGDGGLKLVVIDNDSIMDPTTGFPLGCFGAGNGTYSQGQLYTVDRSPPISSGATAESENGLFPTGDELNVSWRDFDENLSGIIGYDVALTEGTGLPSPGDWVSLGVVYDHTFYPPGDRFEDGTYTFWVRAVNGVLLRSEPVSISVTVSTGALRFGEDILAYEQLDWADVDWGSMDEMDLPNVDSKTIKIDHARLLIAGDEGEFSITWKLYGEEPYTKQYFTSSESVQDPPMIVYHTHDGRTKLGRGPRVNLSNIAAVNIHYNSAIPEADADCDPGGSSASCLWVDTACASGITKCLGAREKDGLIVLHYDRTSNPTSATDFIGIEVVRVKLDEPDVASMHVYLGSRLLPLEAAPGAVSIVRRGSPDYIYQHALPGAQQEGELWAVRENETLSEMEVYWMRGGQESVLWPYEYRQYTSDWAREAPERYQLYIRGNVPEDLGPPVAIPASLGAEIVYEAFEDPFHHSYYDVWTFWTDGPGWTLLKYQTGPSPGLDWVGFEVVRSVLRDDPDFSDLIAVAHDIGVEITDPYHEGPEKAYIHVSQGDRYAPEVYEQETGQIFAVNTGRLEVWWKNLSRVEDPDGPAYPAWPGERVPWPSKAMRYDAVWPTGADKIIIARQNGTGDLGSAIYGDDWLIYGADGSKNDPTQPGFNPNDEHALSQQSDTGTAVFALRDDLGRPGTSEPYVLIQYRQQPENGLWRFKAFRVVREQAPYFFRDWVGISPPEDRYEGSAGDPVTTPSPLGESYCPETTVVSGPAFEDRTGLHWVKAAGNDGGSAVITMRYYYRVREGFYFPESTPAVNDCVPWLDDGTGTPVDVEYTVRWPESLPQMRLVQTLIEAMHELPEINGNCSVDLLYQQSVANGAGSSVNLIDPVQTREVDLVSVPGDILTEGDGATVVFPELSLALRLRVDYDSINRKLRFRGIRVDPVIGFDYALLNVMSQRERDELLALSTDNAWQGAVGALYLAAKDPVEIADSSEDPFDVLALTSGFAQGVGYVTLVMNDAVSCSDPVAVKIIEVIPQLDPGGIMVITPDCPFDETLTLRHKGDFGGRTDNYEFEWRYRPDEGGTEPPGPYDTWTLVSADSEGAVDFTIQSPDTPPLLILSDNWYTVRYRYAGIGLPWSGQWSDWSSAQLAEGWIKRVVGEINPFDQRASGGGIEGAEGDFFSYRDTEVNTIVSMISQAGPRWEGDVPLTCKNLDDFGLLEIYETVLGRGILFSIESLPPANYPPANQALLLVASRIADLYLLLGNEAYADSVDPTIAFGTDDGQYGAEATSIHPFMNTTSSLLREELALLRGRDDSLAPGVEVAPLYNRLIWNFTNGQSGGEVAYALNYNIIDWNDDGSIDEADAKAEYPQGHGDAWGHYLTAIKTYYDLLRHPNYTWNPRSEAVLVGGTPVTVDYLDERKFASVAAAKARAGAETVNLIYREAYVEDPDGQWQGYRDEEADRGWGLTEWASRAGRGAYFDWVVGNAILPSEDPDPEHSGIQKIDRTTVLELREVPARSDEIQAQLDTADLGLNPLGLATNVVPFDISPTEIDQGKTHFEQIYDRAVVAMNNAITVFNHANNSTQLLRRQADTLTDFQQNVDGREVDFTNRLIELCGYPYEDDIGPGRTYPTGYDGPDLYHHAYVDVTELMGVEPPPVIELPLIVRDLGVLENGAVTETLKEVVFHISTSADRFGLIKPSTWTSQRRAPGELQLARSDLLQARARFERALLEYDDLLNSIDAKVQVLRARHDLDAKEINHLNWQLSEQQTLQDQIASSRSKQLNARKKARTAILVGGATAEVLPHITGWSFDLTSAARGAVKLAASRIAEDWTRDADQEGLAELDHQHASAQREAAANITLTTARTEFAVLEQLKELERLVRGEATQRLELYTVEEVMHQAAGRYMSALARMHRLLEDRRRFRQQTAAEVQSRRYKDMAFRIFRNDALQKYRAQFDLAARYVYLAAKAYDFETSFLSSDWRAGSRFLTDIVGARLIGTISSGLPQTGTGLADPLARMSQNFVVLKGQLGFNNPQQETNRFSLRSELFRVQPGFGGNAVWRETLWRHVVPNLLDLDDFERYARVFQPHAAVEPAIVIPFTTNVNFALNFFGWPAGGGDNAYDSTNFATKVRSVGVWFSNYNNLGMINTPRVYLIPVGDDILRSPTGHTGEMREFKILDQRLPVPFPVSAGDLSDPAWIPRVDTLSGIFAEVRKYSSFRAYHDAGQFNPAETIRDSRLIGRSVWNTKWLLVIPAGTLFANRDEGLRRFIDGMPLGGDARDGNGVSDIKIFFETYAYSGN